MEELEYCSKCKYCLVCNSGCRSRALFMTGDITDADIVDIAHMYSKDIEHLEENIEITREVKNYANKKNVSVEAELGSLSGEEDSISGKLDLVNPSDCSYFISATSAV